MQSVFILPLTRESEHLFYNVRMIIDNKVLTEPRAWKITKVNRLDANGLTKITLAQDRFDAHKDYIELNESGEVMGMWADYFAEGQVEPVDYNPIVNENLHMEITYSGTKPEIKVNGSFKKLTAKFYEDEEEQPYASQNWSYALKDGDIITPIVDTSEYLEISNQGVTSQQVKIKFIGDASNIGKVLVVYNEETIYGVPVSASVELEIKSL